MSLRAFSSILVSTLFAVAAHAQLGLPKGARFDVQSELDRALAGTYSNSFGVVRDGAKRYFVSTARQNTLDTHKLVRLSSQGVFEKAYALPSAVQASANGLYDLAYDEVGDVIYGGSDYGTAGRWLFVFDVATETFLSPIPVPATVPGGAARALAFDPNGNLGGGSFWIGDGASAISEISKTGVLLRTAPAIHPATQAAACDPERGLVWWFGPGSTTRSNQGVVGKAMLTNGATASTLVVLGDNSIAGTPPGGTVRGVEFYESGTDHEDLFFVILTDATKDHVYEMGPRFHVEDGCTGATIDAEGDACYAGNTNYKITMHQSGAPFAALAISTSENGGILMTSPPFQANCFFYLDFFALQLLPAVQVVGGKATQPAPIPASVFGASVFLQWVELIGPSSYGLSHEGEVYIHG